MKNHMEDDLFDIGDTRQREADVRGMIGNIDHAIAQLSEKTTGVGTGNQYLEAFISVFLHARTLYTDYFALSLTAGKVNSSLREDVVQSLQRALDALPETEFPADRDQIRNGIREILRLPAIILQIEREA